MQSPLSSQPYHSKQQQQQQQMNSNLSAQLSHPSQQQQQQVYYASNAKSMMSSGGAIGGVNSPMSATTTTGMSGSLDKTRMVRQEVDQVVNIMQGNIERLMERGENLDSLHSKTDNLQAGAMEFRKGAVQVKKRMWWQNAKMNLVIAVVVSALVLILLFGIILPLTRGKK